MKPRVYIETSVVSYLTAWPSNNVIAAERQRITQVWWATADVRFERVVSEDVIDEISQGDPDAARDRLAVLESITRLSPTPEAAILVQLLIESGTMPKKAAEDATHVAIAVTNKVEYLVSWNCKHIANPTIRMQIETICRNAGYLPTILCTPQELLEESSDERE